MKRQAVQSSNVDEIGYDAGALTLEITFKSGGTYQYRGVTPAVHAEMMAAPSKGGFFAQRIKGKYQSEKQ